MTLLALNSRISRRLRLRYHLALHVLPFTLSAAPLLALWSLTSWLESLFGLVPGAPVRTHPNAVPIMLATLGLLGASLFLGYALGWLLNAVVARLLLRWSPERVHAVFMRSELPAQWFKGGAESVGEAQLQAREAWSSMRRIGPWRFVLLRLVPVVDGCMLCVLYLLPPMLKGQPWNAQGLAFNLLVWTGGGVCLGWALWRLLESRHATDGQAS